MDYLPVFMSLKGALCLVVGGGEVAARKIALLLDAGADVKVVAPDVSTQVAELAAAARLHWVPQAFEATHLNDVVLVVASTSQREVNERVARLASAKRIPVNVVDDPALCSFIMPAIIDRSPVVVAVSTGGASPVLARLLREQLETFLPPTLGKLAGWAASLRSHVKEKLADARERRRLWEWALASAPAEEVLAGRSHEATRLLDSALREGGAPLGVSMGVHVITVSSMQTDDLTLRALRAMQRADACVLDAALPSGFASLCRRDAHRATVASSGGSVGELLLDLAQRYGRVVRIRHAAQSSTALSSETVRSEDRLLANAAVLVDYTECAHHSSEPS